MKRLLLTVGLFAASAACRGADDVALPQDLLQALPVSLAHAGPAVSPGGLGTEGASGPARFVPALHARFDRDHAMGTVAFVDERSRDAGSEGHEAVLDRLVADLYAAGYGAEPGFTLDVLRDGLSHPAWTPISAVLEFVKVDANGAPIQAIGVQSFDGQAARERALLPAHAPGCDVTARVADGLEALTEPGLILLTQAPAAAVIAEATRRGAVAVISYHSGAPVESSLPRPAAEAVALARVAPGTTLPCFQVSPRIADAIRNTARVDGRLRMRAVVRFVERPVRTLVATIDGSDSAAEVVHIVAPTDGAAASEGAAPVGALLEGALLLKRLIDERVVPRPRRSLSLVFGVTGRPSALAATARSPVAAIALDGLGADPGRTGASPLLARGADPTTSETKPREVAAHGLAVIVREALIDVAQHELAGAAGEAWATTEDSSAPGGVGPYAGRDIAACRLALVGSNVRGTHLDRADRLDADALRRSAVAALAAALAVADASPLDLERHLDSLNLERQLRLDEAVRTLPEGPELEARIAAWKARCDGARHWLRQLCLGAP